MVFGEHDLGARAPFPRIDLVLCRNVLIYFNLPMQRVALETFGFSLRDGGRLVLGPSETVAAMPDAVRRGPTPAAHLPPRAGPSALPLSMATPIRPHRDLEAPLEPAIRATRRDVQIAADSTEVAEALLLDLGARGRRRRLSLLHHPDQHGGPADARDPRPRIRPGLHPSRGVAARRRRSGRRSMPRSGERRTRSVHEIEAADVAADSPRFIETVVRPYRPQGGVGRGRGHRARRRQPGPAGSRSSDRADRRLERAAVVNRRLLRANDELTALVAQLRIANQAMLESSEEAQSGREEVETLNEEFQATNEELETLNEELTASVEELRVANEDLAARTEELRLQTVALEDQKQHREEEHNRLQSVLTSLGDAVVAVDRERPTPSRRTRPMTASSAVRTREIEPEDLAGLPLPRPSGRSSGRHAASDSGWSSPSAIRSGTRRWFEAVTEPLTSEDRTWGGVVAIRDVSERTMRLSLERLMAAAGHELKTPTAAIHNYLQLVERHLTAGEADKAGDVRGRALSQTRRLATLIERLLDVSRIQTGQLELLLEVVDLTAVVRSAVEVAQVLPKAPPIRLTAAPGRSACGPIRAGSSRSSSTSW